MRRGTKVALRDFVMRQTRSTEVGPGAKGGGCRRRPIVGSPIPARREWQEKLIRAVAVIALIYATYWIYWRWTHTANTDPQAVVPSVLLLLAETWAYINMCLFVLLTWKLTEARSWSRARRPQCRRVHHVL